MAIAHRLRLTRRLERDRAALTTSLMILGHAPSSFLSGTGAQDYRYAQSTAASFAALRAQPPTARSLRRKTFLLARRFKSGGHQGRDTGGNPNLQGFLILEDLQDIAKSADVIVHGVDAIRLQHVRR